MPEHKTPREALHLAVLGAGGIGCYYGARLAACGHKVTLVARGAHLAALRDHGLNLEHPDFSFNRSVDACDLDSFVERFQPSDIDVVLVCVKATATSELAGVLKQWFRHSGQTTAVLSLQNGVDNEPQLAAALGDQVVLGGLAVRIGGHIIRPGVVSATGIAQLIVGAWPQAGSSSDECYGERLSQLVTDFNEAGIPTQRVDNIRHELWRKLIINNGVNPLSALTRLDTHALSHHPDFGPLVYAMMQETAQAALADGELLTGKDVEEMYDLIRSFDPIKTSMLVDLEKGRPLEADAICGVVLQRSSILDKPAPVTQTVYALIKQML